MQIKSELLFKEFDFEEMENYVPMRLLVELLDPLDT